MAEMGAPSRRHSFDLRAPDPCLDQLPRDRCRTVSEKQSLPVWLFPLTLREWAMAGALM